MSNPSNNSNDLIKIFFVVSTFLVITMIVGSMMFLNGNSESNVTDTVSNTSSAIDESGKQILALTAKGGYSPKVITAKAGQATVLKVKTNNTFDCSSGLLISSLGVRKNLPSNGETAIEIPAQTAGSEVKGTCTMGMYNFLIKFI